MKSRRRLVDATNRAREFMPGAVVVEGEIDILKVRKGKSETGSGGGSESGSGIGIDSEFLFWAGTTCELSCAHFGE